MGWLIALGLLTLTALIPLGLRFRYDENGAVLSLLIGSVPIPLKSRGRQKKTKEKKEKKPSGTGAKKGKSTQKSAGGSLTDFLPILQTILSFITDFRRGLRITRLDAKVILGGGDPCDLALNYGKAQAAVGNLMPLLHKYFNIKKQNVEVECDFTSEDTKVFVNAALSIPIYLIFYLFGRYGFRAVRQYLPIHNKRKGGAKNESKTSQYAGKYHRKNS